MFDISWKDSIALRGLLVLICVYVPLFLVQIATPLLGKRRVEWMRAVSMTVLVVVIYLAVLAPSWVLASLIALLTAFGMKEIYDAATVKNADNVTPFFRRFSYIASVLTPAVFLFAPSQIPPFLILAVSVLFMYPVISQDATRALDRAARALIGLIFAAMIAHLILLRQGPDGIALCLFLIFLTNVTDIAAYTFGRLLGRRKLAPLISSGKTVEGTVFACVITVLVGIAFRYALLPSYPLPKIVVVSLVIALAAQLGDLILSVFKRDVGIKDYSHVIPGQGGVLDRFDSLILCAPFFYYSLGWF